MTSETRGGTAREHSFSLMYNRFIAPVRSQVRLWVSESEVDEIVSATFLTAWSRFDEIDDTTEKAWLLGVARNHCRNNARSHRRTRALVEAIEAMRPITEEEPFGDGVDPSDIVPVMTALESMDEDLQEILILAAWHELSPAEIAITLSISSNAARVRLHRARNVFVNKYRRVLSREDGQS